MSVTLPLVLRRLKVLLPELSVSQKLTSYVKPRGSDSLGNPVIRLHRAVVVIVASRMRSVVRYDSSGSGAERVQVSPTRRRVVAKRTVLEPRVREKVRATARRHRHIIKEREGRVFAECETKVGGRRSRNETRTYLKIVVLKVMSFYNCIYASIAR